MNSSYRMTEVGLLPDDWDAKRFSECFTLVRNNTYARECLTDHPGSVANVHYGDVLIKYGAVLDFAKNAVPYLKSDVKPNKDMLRDGDLVFADTAEDEAVGKAVEVQGLKSRMAVAGLHTVASRPHDGLFAQRYLGYYINSAAYHNQLLPLITGTKVSSVSRACFLSTYVAIPPKSEQRRIAGALSDVDELISALGKLIEKKRNIKTGAMQELLGMRNAECGMRNVPRRLAGFSGAWVEKRFDDCFELIGNNTYARECMCDDCDGLANIHYGDVLIRYGSVLDCSRTAVPSLIKSIICRTDRLSDGDVIIADTAEDETVGKAIEIRGLKGRRAVSGLHTIACRPRFDFAPGWLGYYINSSAFHDQLLPLITGTKVSSISRAGLRTTILNVPTLAEQQAIAAVLSDMDAEIAALEAKRAKYESIKQGMMQELLTGKIRLSRTCESAGRRTKPQERAIADE